jgi:hypothetical protein
MPIDEVCFMAQPNDFHDLDSNEEFIFSANGDERLSKPEIFFRDNLCVREQELHLALVKEQRALDGLRRLPNIRTLFPEATGSLQEDPIAPGLGHPVEKWKSRVRLYRKPKVWRLHEISRCKSPDFPCH